MYVHTLLLVKIKIKKIISEYRKCPELPKRNFL